MVSTAILLVMLVVASVTDIRWRRIFNWTCYPGIVLAVALSAAATWFRIDNGHAAETRIGLWGIVPLADSLLGLFACGMAMLVCYVLFAGAFGGGDVKLMAMVGAFLGTVAGLEALLWTFVLGACQALITLVWKYGWWNVARQTVSFLWLALRTGGRARLSATERQPLQTDLFLSPSALAAVVIVRFGLLDRLSV